MTTVLTVPGTFGLPQYVEPMLRGEITHGRPVVPVYYNTVGVFDVNVADGLGNLDDAINATPGPKIVFGHSLGAVVATRWLAQIGPTSDVPPSELSFVLIGNSARKYNGVLHYTFDGLAEVLGGDWEWLPIVDEGAIPADTPYTVHDFARQYDGFADFPNLIDNPNFEAAAVNAITGMALVHINYLFDSLSNPANRSYVEGNVTYTISPTRGFWQPQYLFPFIEQAYDRPVGMGPPRPPAFVPRKSTPLRKITEGNDAITKYRLLDARRQLVIDANRQRPLIRLWDKRFHYLGTVSSERSAEYERLIDDSGVGTISLRWSDWLAQLAAHDTRVQEDLHLTIDPNPNLRSWRTRLGYRVTDVRAVKHEDGTRTIEIDIISLREHAKHLLLGATPFSPPEFQPLKSWIWFQNLRSNLAFATFINLARSFWPILSLPTSLFDPAHWLTTRVGNLSPLHWPIQAQFCNPVLDTSRILPLTAKWQDLHTISAPLMEDAGVALIDYIWLPEDTTSPHPELAQLVGEKLARPSRACVVLAFEDKSGVTGPTGTAFDGAVNLIGTLADDLITETILPLDVDEDGRTDPFFRKFLGVAPEKPSLVWRDTEYSGLISSEHKLTRGGSRTVWTGGHSPTILNQAISFGVKYGLAQLSELFYTPSGLAVTGAMAPGTPGLEEAYQGQFDDILLAYEKFTNPQAALWLNDYSLLEGFEQGNGYAYTVSAILTIRQGLKKRDPKVSFTMNAKDGEPNCWGYDYTVGDRGLFEIDAIFYAEQIRAAKWAYDENKPIDLKLVIGRNRESDPFEAGMKALADGWNAIGSLIGGAAVAN